MLTQDIPEELFLFLEIRRLEKGSDHRKSSATTMSSERYLSRRTAADNFLYSEKDKSDYEWLVTPPGSPGKTSNQLDASGADLMALNSKIENCVEEEIKDNISSINQRVALKRPSSNSSRSTSRCSTPATRSTSRPSTPTRRSTTIATMSTSRPSTPTRRTTTIATRSATPTTHVTTTTTRASSTTSSSRTSSRPSSSSGTSRDTLTSSSTSRPSTPTRRPSSSGTSRANLTNARAPTLNTQTTGIATSSTRSKTRPMTAPNTKPGSRPSTPTRRPPTPVGSSTLSKSKPTKPVPAPTSRSRPWEPYEMPGFSIEAPPNLRTTLPDRPQTASSCRSVASGASSSRSASTERSAVSRRQSCSPSRNRAPIGNVAKGNQMDVERNGNVKKVVPRRIKDNGGSNAVKSSSTGFGGNISKSSFDMALRHMDTKRGSMTGNFRQLVTKVPAATLYSVRASAGTRRKRPVSSSGRSESSSVNILCLDGSDDNLSDISYS